MNILLATILILSSFFGGTTYQNHQNEKVLTVLKKEIQSAEQSVQKMQIEMLQNLGSQLAVAGETYYLSGSGITSTQTTVNLTKFGYTKPDGTYQKFTMGNFGALGCGTVQPGNQSGKQEFVSFTGITQNSDGSAQLTGVARGLERFSPYTASSTLRSSHSGSSQFVISNSPPCFYENYVTINNAETISSVKTFASTTAPKYDAQYTASGNEFVSYNQLNAVVIGEVGTSTENALGLVQLATTAQAVAGTASSTTGAPLVVPAKQFGNTYHSASTSMAVMTGSTGTLDSNFIATSSSNTYKFAGAISIASSSPQSYGLTVGATTTTANLAVASSTISINGVTMRFPSAIGASSTALWSDGNNKLFWDNPSIYQCGEQVLTGANATTTVTIDARKDLEIIFDSPGASGNAVPTITFNTDYAGGGTNYGHHQFTDYVSTSNTNGRASIETTTFSTSTAQSFKAFMRNTATIQKRIDFNQTAGALNRSIFTGMGTWNNNTDQVTTINVTTGTASITWNAGTRLTVMCSRD